MNHGVLDTENTGSRLSFGLSGLQEYVFCLCSSLWGHRANSGLLSAFCHVKVKRLSLQTLDAGTLISAFAVSSNVKNTLWFYKLPVYGTSLGQHKCTKK